MTAKADVVAGGWSVSAGFVDYDNDGKLNLFVTRYGWDLSQRIWGTSPQIYWSKSGFPATTNVLYRNRTFPVAVENGSRSRARARARWKSRALGIQSRRDGYHLCKSDSQDTVNEHGLSYYPLLR